MRYWGLSYDGHGSYIAECNFLFKELSVENPLLKEALMWYKSNFKVII